jgi:hypothetical protein
VRSVASLPGGNTIEFTGVAVADLETPRGSAEEHAAERHASPCVFAGDTYFCSAKVFTPDPTRCRAYAATVEAQVRQSMRKSSMAWGSGADLANAVATNST